MKNFVHIAFSFIITVSYCFELAGQSTQQVSTLKNNAYYFFQEQQYTQAVNTAKKLPDSYDKYLLLGASYLNTSNYKTAEKWLEKGLNNYPDSLQFTIMQIESSFFQEEYLSSIEIYEQLLEKQSSSKISDKQLKATFPKIAYAYQKLAVQAVSDQDFSKGEKLYKKALSIEKSVQSYLGLIFALMEQSKWDAVIKYAKIALKMYPNNPDLLGLLANAYFKTENFKLLQSVYTQIYELNKDDLQKALLLGEVMVANMDYEAAQKHYDMLLSDFKYNNKVYEAALNISSQFRNLESRQQILKKKMLFIPSKETGIKLAQTYQLSGNIKPAISLYDSLILANPTEESLKIEFIKIYERRDSLYSIKDLLEDFIKKHPETSYFKIALLKANKKVGCSEALRLSDEYAQLSNAKINEQRALIYYECKRLAQGLRVLQHLSSSNENTVTGHYLLAKLSISTDSLFEKRATYLKIAAYQLLKNINRLESEINNLTLSDPFNAYWLDVPSIKRQIKRNQAYLTEIINLSSENLSLSNSNQMLAALKNDFPDNARLLFLIGQHHAFQREKERAKAYYEAAIKIEPSLLEAQYEWARLNEKSNQIQQAIAGYERVLAIDDQFEPGYSGLIRLYRKKGQLDKLTDRWNMIYGNAQQNTVLKEALIEALHKQGKLEEASALSNNDQIMNRKN